MIQLEDDFTNDHITRKSVERQESEVKRDTFQIRRINPIEREVFVKYWTHGFLHHPGFDLKVSKVSKFLDLNVSKLLDMNASKFNNFGTRKF